MGIAKRIIRYRINSWFLSSQLGTVGHTLRDGSQENWIVTLENVEVYAGKPEMAASPSKMTWARRVTWI
jgi:hypothetical protein